MAVAPVAGFAAAEVEEEPADVARHGRVTEEAEAANEDDDDDEGGAFE